MADPRIGVIVVAAGVGSRLGAAMPKAFVPLAGRSLLAWSVEAAVGCPGVVCVVVVAPPGHVAEAGRETDGYATVPVRVVARWRRAPRLGRGRAGRPSR